MTLSLIGTSGSGKSTVIGLLFQALERYAARNNEDFTLFVPKRYTESIYQDIRDPMLRGHFPMKTEQDDMEHLKFLIGFKPKGKEWIKKLPDVARQRVFQSKKFGSFLGFIFTVYDIAGEDVEDMDMDNEDLKKAFDCQIPIFLLNVEKFTLMSGDMAYDDMIDYNSTMGSIAGAFAQYRSQNKPDEKFYPIMLFSKVDGIEKKIGQDYKIDKLRKNKKYKQRLCQNIGNELSIRFIQSFRTQISGSQQLGIKMSEAPYFYSWVDTQKDENVEQFDAKLVVNTEKGFPSNAYPLSQYEALIEYLREKAYEGYSTPAELIEELLSDGSAVIPVE